MMTDPAETPGEKRNRETMTPSEELTRYRRRVFPTLFLAIFAAMLGIGIIAPLLPIYARELGAEGVKIGLLFSAFSLTRMVAMPTVGRISDRHGRKGFLLVGLAMYSLLSIGYTLTTDYWVFTGIRVVHGLGSAMVVPIAMALIAEMAPAGREGEYMGTISMALFAGFGAGPLVGGLLHDRWGMAFNFYSLAVLAGVSFVLVWRLLPKPVEAIRRRSVTPKRYREILANRRVFGLFVYRFVNAMGRGAIFVYLPLFAHERLGLSTARIGVLLSVYILLISFLQRPFGRLADRVNRVTLILVGTGASAVMFVFLPQTSGLTTVAVVLILMGVASSISLPAATAMIAEEGAAMGMGSTMALFNVAFSAGLGLGPLAAGVVDGVAGMSAVFYAAGGALAVGIALLAVLLAGTTPSPAPVADELGADQSEA